MQFSLRTLLAAVAAVGFGAALWVAEPSWKVGAVEALLLAWVPGSAIVLSIYSQGRLKAFWIGCALECILPPVAALNMGFIISPRMVDFPDPAGTIPYFLESLAYNISLVLLSWAVAPVVGLLCVLTHWLLVRKADPKG